MTQAKPSTSEFERVSQVDGVTEENNGVSKRQEVMRMKRNEEGLQASEVELEVLNQGEKDEHSDFQPISALQPDPVPQEQLQQQVPPAQHQQPHVPVYIYAKANTKADEKSEALEGSKTVVWMLLIGWIFPLCWLIGSFYVCCGATKKHRLVGCTCLFLLVFETVIVVACVTRKPGTDLCPGTTCNQ